MSNSAASSLRPALRLFAFGLVILLMAVTAGSARAEPPSDEVRPLEDVVADPSERIDREIDQPAFVGASGSPAAPPPLWLSLGATVGDTIGRTSVGFFVALAGTFDRTARPRFARLEPELRAKTQEDEDAPPQREAEPPRAPEIDGRFARGLIQAVQKASRRSESDDRLDGLATRARVSALLPEVRVRVARNVDEGESLSPTEYDPDRVTATGGTSLWVEGRATFRLDRLVFADDEIQIERLRADREKAERALVKEALGALADWQKAKLQLADPAIVGDAAIDARAAELAALATLDVLTNGWFSEHAGALDAGR